MKRVIIPDDIKYTFCSANVGFKNVKDAIAFSNFCTINEIPFSIHYNTEIGMIFIDVEGTIRPCYTERFYGEEDAKGFDFLIIEY